MGRDALKKLARRLVAYAKYRCKIKGGECTITPEDIEIPGRCPICDRRFDRGVPSRRATIDQILPKGGYTPLNTWVLCFRCNQIKSEGTPEEHRRIADRTQEYIERLAK